MTASADGSVPERTHRASRWADERGQRGSALVIAMLVTVILALLAISFLLLAETENKISRNEKLATQTFYVAETALHVTKQWFDYTDGSMHFPPPAAVDRTLRQIIDETDPYDPADMVAADGILGSYPYYKQGVDQDGDGNDDLFGKPYRGGTVHALLGTPDGPDMRIDDSDAAAATFLENLSETVLAGFPDEPGAVLARISRIDVYAPPYEEIGGVWRRYGMGTIEVTARIYQDTPGGRRTLAERKLEAVFGEVPYRGPHAPLHSCADTDFVPRAGDSVTIRWGTLSSVGDVDVALPSPPTRPPVPASLPRELPFQPGVDQLWPTVVGDFDLHRDNDVRDLTIDDPWFRIVAGGQLQGAPSGTQPFLPHPGGTHQDYSNLFHELPLVVCPRYDYEMWKIIAMSGGPDVHYFAHAGGINFRENATGPLRSFQDITNGSEGLYFFDTANGQPPTDADANELYDNLTPAIAVSGAWDFNGFIYLNAESLQANGVTGPMATIHPPGEPFLDENVDGKYDPGERYINLDYTSASALSSAIDAFNTESPPSRDKRGSPVANVPVSFGGILYTTGALDATGSGTFYGSVIAIQGVTQSAPGVSDTPLIIWDESIVGGWPPAGSRLPRVVITEWDLGS